MNPALTTVATFSIGVLCGYLLRKNWFLIRSVLGKKPRSRENNKSEKPKNESTQAVSKQFAEETEQKSNVSFLT